MIEAVIGIGYPPNSVKDNQHILEIDKNPFGFNENNAQKNTWVFKSVI